MHPELINILGLFCTICGVAIGLLFQSEILEKTSDPLRVKEDTKQLIQQLKYSGSILAALALLFLIGQLYIRWPGSNWIGNTISIFAGVIAGIIFFCKYRRL